jgi:hypothetical protein
MLFVTLLKLPDGLVYGLSAAKFTELLGGIVWYGNLNQSTLRMEGDPLL